MPLEDMIEIRAIVKGRVQGIGFRAMTYQYALEMGLVGTVKNLSDGSVELYVLGDRLTVQNLLNVLRQEFRFISEVQIEEIVPHHTYNGFRIIS
jgi:acylphosphatase